MNSNLNEKLKKLRELKHMTQGDLANLSRVSQSLIANYENGNRKFTQKTLDKILDALGVTTAEFYSGNIDTSGSLSVSTPAPVIRISNKEDKPPTTEISILKNAVYIMEHGSDDQKKLLNQLMSQIIQDVDRKKASSPDKVASSQEQEHTDCETVGRKAA